MRSPQRRRCATSVTSMMGSLRRGVCSRALPRRTDSTSCDCSPTSSRTVPWPFSRIDWARWPISMPAVMPPSGRRTGRGPLSTPRTIRCSRAGQRQTWTRRVTRAPASHARRRFTTDAPRSGTRARCGCSTGCTRPREGYARWLLRALYWAAIPACLYLLARGRGGRAYAWLTGLILASLGLRAAFICADERYQLPVDLLAVAWLMLTLRYSLTRAPAPAPSRA